MAQFSLQSINLGDSFDSVGGYADVLKQKLEAFEALSKRRIFTTEELQEYLKTLQEFSQVEHKFSNS